MKIRILYTILILSLVTNSYFVIQYVNCKIVPDNNFENKNSENTNKYATQIYKESYGSFIDTRRTINLINKVDSNLIQTYLSLEKLNTNNTKNLEDIINEYFDYNIYVLNKSQILIRSTSTFPEYLEKTKIELLNQVRENKLFSDYSKRNLMSILISVNQSITRTIYGESNNKLFSEYMIFDSFMFEVKYLKQTNKMLTGELSFLTRPVDTVFKLFISDKYPQSAKVDSNALLDTILVNRDNMKLEYLLNKTVDSINFWIEIDQGLYKYTYLDNKTIKKN